MTWTARTNRWRRAAATLGASLAVLVVAFFGGRMLGLIPPAVGSPCDRPQSAADPLLDPWVIASKAVPEHPTYAALDGDFDTWWGAEAHPTQWIEVGLDTVTDVAELRLTTSQTPAGPTEHRVYGRVSAAADPMLLHTFNEDTADGDVLSVLDPSWTPICFLRVVTVASPSWVSWREIEIVAAP